MIITVVGEAKTGIEDMIEELGKLMYFKVLVNEECPKITDDIDINASLYSDYYTNDEVYMFVIVDKKYIDRLPSNSKVVLFTAALEDKERAWKIPLGGSLPFWFRLKLKREHGCFDSIRSDLHFVLGEVSPESQARQIFKLIHEITGDQLFMRRI